MDCTSMGGLDRVARISFVTDNAVVYPSEPMTCLVSIMSPILNNNLGFR